jgi:hypothetical protein
VLAGAALSATAQDIPAHLPSPDGRPANPAKPVKVYILAGQSNMVGMGTLSGAQNSYAGIYLSSDPETPAGPLDIWLVGRFKTAPLAVFNGDGTPARDPVAQGSFEVPERGVYQIQCGSGESSFVSMDVAGKPAYSRAAGNPPVRHEITLDPGKRHPFTITGFTGEAPRFWLRKQDLLGNGDLEAVVKRDGMFRWLMDGTGNWSTRQDVWLQEARLTPGGKGSPLIPTWNAKTFGPEIGFGHVLGTFHDEAVLLIKTAQGNRSLAYDYNRNAETYLRVGDAMGRAMVGLSGGKAEALPQPPRPRIAAHAPEPTEEQKTAARAKLTPIILDGIVPAFIANPQNQPAITAEAKGERPQRPNQFLRCTIDALVFLNEFNGGKVTIAATSFLRYKPTTSGHLTVWIEQQKLPPLGL